MDNNEQISHLSMEDEFICIDCDTEVEPMDIPLCGKCREKYDLDRLWKDHDAKGFPEPWDFMDKDRVRWAYIKVQFRKLTKDEWDLFTSIYDEGVQDYRMVIGSKDDRALDFIRDKLEELIAPIQNLPEAKVEGS